MYFSALAVLALAHTALAQTPFFDVLTSPASETSYKVGEILPIVWTPGPDTGKITIVLNGGATISSLNLLMTVGSAIDGSLGKLDWVIPSAGVGSYATYGLNLTLDSAPLVTFQSSFPFHITGGGEGTTTSSTSSGSTSTVSSSSSVSSTSSASTTSTSTSVSSSISSSAEVKTSSSASRSATGTATTTSFAGYTNGTVSRTTSSSATGAATETLKAGGASANKLSGLLALSCVAIFAFVL